MEQFCASFNNASTRIQNGGWARQVMQYDFQISETIAGVNMRLTAGGIRELDWHLAAEWAFVTYGTCRITVLDPAGQAYVADVNEGELWIFPSGYPHSLLGLGPDGCEFILAFNDGKASEVQYAPGDRFCRAYPAGYSGPEFPSFRVSAEAFSKIPLHDRYIFRGDLPGSLAADQAAVLSPEGPPEKPVQLFPEGCQRQTVLSRRSGRYGADRRQPQLPRQHIASSLVTLRPGGLRELYWQPNADEWQYYIKFQTTNFNSGEIGYVKRNTSATMVIMSRTSATPSCSSSKYSKVPSSRTSPCPTG